MNAQHPSAFFPYKVKAFCPSILSSHYTKAKHLKKGTWLFEAVREMHSTVWFSRQLLLWIYLFVWPVSHIQPGAKQDWQRGSLHSDTFLSLAKSNQPVSKSLFLHISGSMQYRIFWGKSKTEQRKRKASAYSFSYWQISQLLASDTQPLHPKKDVW